MEVPLRNAVYQIYLGKEVIYMKKRLAVLALSLAMVLPLVACGSSGGASASANPSANTEGSSSDYPKSTITLVCPWDAGGTSDGLTRIIAEIGARKDYFGVNMVVQNSGGAGGTVATTEFKNTAGDGYTICQEAIGVFTLQPYVRDVDYTIGDFIPVAALSNEPIIMIAGKNSGITSLDDLLARKSVTYGFSGSGSLMELSQKQFFSMTDVDATGVSYDGSSPTLAALLGGHIDVAVGHPGEVMQYVQSGDAVAIGIFNDERDPREGIKDIPTFKEQGYDVVMSVWKFLIVPATTPQEIVDKITTTLNDITATDEYTQFCEKNNLLPLTLTTDEMVQRINDEAAVNQALLAG